MRETTAGTPETTWSRFSIKQSRADAHMTAQIGQWIGRARKKLLIGEGANETMIIL